MEKSKKVRMNRRSLAVATTGMLIAIGVLLPQAFHFIPNAGQVFLPMHIPVLLCGLLCGGAMGAICGAITPALSSLIFGMPIAPNGLVPMLFELLTYGLVAGLIGAYARRYGKKSRWIYLVAMFASMLCGRVISIIVKMVFLSAILGGAVNKVFTAAIMSSFVTCWPGIIIQATLIPLLLAALSKAGVLSKYENVSPDCEKNETRQG